MNNTIDIFYDKIYDTDNFVYDRMSMKYVDIKKNILTLDRRLKEIFNIETIEAIINFCIYYLSSKPYEENFIVIIEDVGMTKQFKRNIFQISKLFGYIDFEYNKFEDNKFIFKRK